MKEQFVTYEIALKLKELGFDEPCLAFYDIHLNLQLGHKPEYLINNEKANYIFGNDKIKILLAPLYHQVIDWFRVKYNICVVIQCVNWRLGKQFEGYLCKFQTKEMIDKGDYSKYIYLSDLFITYEETREYIILKAIELCQKEK